MSSYRLMFPGVSSSLVFSGFGLKPPPSGFHLILTVASRLLHPYSTDDKTFRLKMKSFSTVGEYPERFTELNEEEKREEGDRGDQEEKRGKSKEERES